MVKAQLASRWLTLAIEETMERLSHIWDSVRLRCQVRGAPKSENNRCVRLLSAISICYLFVLFVSLCQADGVRSCANANSQSLYWWVRFVLEISGLFTCRHILSLLPNPVTGTFKFQIIGKFTDIAPFRTGMWKHLQLQVSVIKSDI